MASISDLQARLEALKEARALGLLSVGHGDARVQYRTMDEMSRAIGYVEQEIAEASGSQITRTMRITSSKDL